MDTLEGFEELPVGKEHSEVKVPIMQCGIGSGSQVFYKRRRKLAIAAY